MPFWTLKTDDPNYEGADGYHVGASLEHVLLSWLSTTYRFFGESRDVAIPKINAIPGVPATYERGRWSAYNASLAAFLFGFGAGAIAQVVVQLAPSLRDAAGRTLQPAVVTGLLAGMAVMFATGLLVSI